MKAYGLTVAIFVMCLQVAWAEAQTPKGRTELGVHATIVDLNSVFEIPGGVGARFTYNITDNLAFDSELNYFPRKSLVSGLTLVGFPNRADAASFGETQGLFGIKAGTRVGNCGLFGKVRPGFMHFRRRQITESFDNQSKTRPAVDIGGVFEYYPARKVALRVDLGYTLIPLGGRTIQGPDGPIHFDTGLRNFQGGFGISYRL